MARPFALHVTWTTYATWLPGDERGYVSNTLDPAGGFTVKQNQPGTPYTADDAFMRGRARALQKWPTVRLTAEQALVVAEACVQAASERGWHILRGAVMTNHTHMVVTECPEDGPAVRRALKGVSQAALSRQLGKPARWWTEGGSDRYKHDQAAIDAAVNYVAKQPGMLAGIEDMQVFLVGREDSR